MTRAFQASLPCNPLRVDAAAGLNYKEARTSSRRFTGGNASTFRNRPMTQATLEPGRAQAVEAADFIRRGSQTSPRVGILTGTGLGGITAGCRVEQTFAYSDIPHFPVSTVPSHDGRLAMGTLAGQPVAALQGRFHLYEGYGPGTVTFPIRVLQELGVRFLVLTNASGGLHPQFEAGDIMLIADHINLTGANPLIGANEERWGPRFPDMTMAYDAGLRQAAAKGTQRLGLPLRTGVYVGIKGPSLETPAEMRFLRSIGADAVGFSTVMETIAAVHAGMRVIGLSAITNVCRPEAAVPASVADIIAVARQATPRLQALIAELLKSLS
jgi:purine-nucleoside phosphorylase